MYAQSSPASVRNRYHALDLSSRMEGATPHGLVTILYEELERSLAASIRAIETGQNVTRNSQIGRARSILVALESGLDFERGGALAETLGTVYRAMQRQLGQGGEDVAKLKEVREGVADMARAWRSLIAPPA